MKKISVLWVLIILSYNASAQTIIKGKVTDESGAAIIGANVYLKATYSGAVSNADGTFSIKTTLTGKKKLVASCIGYTEFTEEIELPSTQEIELIITLHEKANELNSVVCQAGSFGASDSKKAVKLNTFDILTTPTAVGDMYGALLSLPGTAPVDEEGGLFVRGGESYETKTFMDGMLVHKPYTSRTPDLPSRGRYSPTMFSGTMFSTGGYSAEYGQAMSSALVLTTTGLAEKPMSSISILPFGAGISKTFKEKNTSLAFSSDFYNLTPYNAVVSQDIDWNKNPQSFYVSTIYRHQFENGSMIKTFINASNSKSSLWMTGYSNPSQKDLFTLLNNDIYYNTTYFGNVSNIWSIKTGVAYTRDVEKININANDVNNTENDYQIKAVLSGSITESARINFGSELMVKDYKFSYIQNNPIINYSTSFTNYTPVGFAELEYRFSKKLSTRLGTRVEYSSLQNTAEVSPRFSVAFQTSNYSQVSFASGIFYQSPENDCFKYNNKLKNEKAIHYILNYQYIKDIFTFRVEAYYKDYNNLVKYDSLNSPIPETYNNNGYGFARGFDVFLRLNKGFDKNDCWLSYSYLDTKRNYQNYPSLATPTFFPQHTLAATYKKFITKISTLAGFTYTYSSGRTYNNPNNAGFMNSKTKGYNDLSVSLSYVTTLFKQQTVVHASVSNVLGAENVYGYHYSNQPGSNGNFEATPVKAAAKRFYLIGVFISIE
jgi:vitamin B12 transporter